MSDSKEVPRASELIGATPIPAVRAISLPVHHCLSQWVRGSEIPPIILVACSGGADSMALALAAIDSAHRLGCEVHTLTVDHGLRVGSADEAHAVATFLESVGAHAHVLGPADVDTTMHEVTAQSLSGDAGPEGNARAFRYAAIAQVTTQLRLVKKHHPPVFVCLGHTMDDQAETVLLRLARGSGVGSLKAMAEAVAFQIAPKETPASSVLLRPLLSVRRSDTLAFCQALACPVVDDPTNALDGPWTSADGTPLRRSAIRHRALPSLRHSLGVDPTPALARTASLSRDDDEALDYYAHQGLSAARTAAPAVELADSRGLVLDVAALAVLPRAVRRRVLHEACLKAGVPGGALSAQHLMAVDALIAEWNGQGPLHLPGLRVARGKTPDGQAYLSFCAPAP